MAVNAAVVLVGLLASCIEYGTGPGGGLPRVRDTADPPRQVPGVLAPLAVEVCNGLDDDGDGAIDEGFGDWDADGVADCVDEDCELAETAVPVVRPVSCDASLEPSSLPWEVEVYWDFDEVEDCRVDAVADLDGDALPEVLCMSEEQALLVVLDGQTGDPQWTESVYDAWSPIVAADFDQDGLIEIAGLDAEAHVVALEGDGSFLWRSDVPLGPPDGTRWDYAALIAADLEGDGDVEVVSYRGAVSGADGALEVVLFDEEGWTRGWAQDLVVADLDRDGDQEVLYWGITYDSTGEELWRTSSEFASGWHGSTPVPLQADGDAPAEVAWLFKDEWRLLDDDGTELLSPSTQHPLSYSLACAGDLDGDGVPELIYKDPEHLRAWHLDGWVMWKLPVVDESTYTGCSVFDFDLDGLPEVLFGDELGFAIVDGLTGLRLYEDLERVSWTGGEIPLVVDLDGDGSVEIVLGGYAAPWGYSPGVRVYRHKHAEWPPGSTIWPWSAWSGHGAFPDGTVPAHPSLEWLDQGVWRSQPTHVTPGVDLAPEVVGSCLSACEGGAVRVAVRVANHGMASAGADVPLAIYALDEHGSPALLDVVSWASELGPATATEPEERVYARDRVAEGLLLVAGDRGDGTRAVEDCGPADDELVWELPACD